LFTPLTQKPSFLHWRRIATCGRITGSSRRRITASGRIAGCRRIASCGRITGSSRRRITTSRRITGSGRITTSGRIASSGRITTSGRIASSGRITTSRRIATRRIAANHRSTTIHARGAGDRLWRSHAHAVGRDDQMDRTTSPAAREVHKRLGEVVPLVNAAHREALTDGDHANTKSIVGGETIPIENLHLKHISHGRRAVEGELLVPDRGKSVADNLGLLNVVLAKMTNGGKEVSGLVHDAELSERIALAASIGSSKATSFNNTDGDTAHCIEYQSNSQ